MHWIASLPSSQIVVSLVLGFLVVWDMPHISAGVASLKSSRLSPIYNEVAPSLTVFGKLFGKALEAQVGAAGWSLLNAYIVCCKFSQARCVVGCIYMCFLYCMPG